MYFGRDRQDVSPDFSGMIIAGFESGILDGPMTGIANYTFHMVRSALELSPDLRFAGFRRFNWQAVDLAALERIAARQNTRDAESLPRSYRRDAGSIAGAALRSASRSPGFGPARAVYRTLRQRRFASSVRRQSLDLFHAFNFRPLADPGVPVLPVIYDLSTFRHPEFHPDDRVQWLSPLRDILSRAPLVQTISEFSRREIADLFGYPPDKIFIAPPAAAAQFAPIGESAAQRDLDMMELRYGSFFLAVGTLEPRKNLRTLIAAYAQLSPSARARFPLVVAGGAGWGELKFPEQTTALVAEGTLRFVQHVSGPQLRSLYEGARLLVMPSLYEGFGMPVVEALSCGTPVAHSADTAMDEISGTVGKRVAALDVDGWTGMLKEALDSTNHADPVRRQARIAQARQFDWRQSAGLMVDAYRQILR
jgi:alpha-1,3-rhamnosyl/mannosyltransferase